MKGSCKNGQCQAYNRDVWIGKGYGFFGYDKNTVGNLCPQCNTKMNSKSFNNLGYMNAKV